VKSPNGRTRARATIRLTQLAQTNDRAKDTTLFNRAISKFGTLPFDAQGSRTVAQEARDNLFEMENSAIGITAPNISGQGCAFRLLWQFVTALPVYVPTRAVPRAKV
jgi:hypothetical protein